ncbi:hypothetical protein ACSW9O_15850 (plasmid) [Clostridium perfringens]|nr:hypothetical protein [Clostridium perfringens]
MKVRNKEHTWTGISNNFNTHGLGEVIVGIYNKNETDFIDQDSMYVSELEVFLDGKKEWKNMNKAFNDRDIISDNYNTCFKEAKNNIEKERGYF